MRAKLAIGVVIAIVAVSTFAIRRAIVAEHEQRGRQQFATQIAEQLEALEQSRRVDELRRTQRLQLDQLVDSLRRTPNDTSLLVPIGNLMLQVGDTLGALQTYRRYVETVNRTNVVPLTDYAYLLYLTGDRDGGRRLTQRAVTLAPGYQVALYNMAVMEFDRNNIHAAIKWMEQCRAVDSTSPLGQLSVRALEELRKYR
ncbi:MAG: hypothetical protein N2663_08790 [Chlorobi bacterium]|nr:hypothetical protein [Chlorobiota bacterium]